jgi:hypothetical protein
MGSVSQPTLFYLSTNNNHFEFIIKENLLLNSCPILLKFICSNKNYLNYLYEHTLPWRLLKCLRGKITFKAAQLKGKKKQNQIKMEI